MLFNIKNVKQSLKKLFSSDSKKAKQLVAQRSEPLRDAQYIGLITKSFILFSEMFKYIFSIKI